MGNTETQQINILVIGQHNIGKTSILDKCYDIYHYNNIPVSTIFPTCTFVTEWSYHKNLKSCIYEHGLFSNISDFMNKYNNVLELINKNNVHLVLFLTKNLDVLDMNIISFLEGKINNLDKHLLIVYTSDISSDCVTINHKYEIYGKLSSKDDDSNYKVFTKFITKYIENVSFK